MIDPRDLTYNAGQRAAALEAVGWPVETRRTALAVSLAELGEMSPAGIRTAINERPGIERSRGPWQINLEAHPHVGEDCAHDLICSTKEALRISGGGVNFNPWGAFSSGAYTGHLGRADQALGSPAPTSTPDCPIGYTYDPATKSCKSWVPGGIVPNVPIGRTLPSRAGGGSGITIPNPLEGVEGAIDEARKGAAQLAVAAGVLAVAGVLAFVGLRRIAG